MSLVVGFDGSECAEAALRTALTLGKQLDERVVVAFGFDVNPLGGETHDYKAVLEEHAQGVLAKATEQAQAEGVEIEPVVIEVAPAHGLVELAKLHDARAIIVGTRGEGPLRGALVGSTPHKLLQLADRPVLVVPE